MSNDLELLVRAYTDQLQELDAAATALLTETSISGAEGVQLDGLGQIIGIDRQGFDDDDYRALLSAYIRVNTSGGTIEQLNEIIRLASNTSIADASFYLVEGDPAEFMVEFTDALPLGRGAVVADSIYQAKAAGVHGVLLYHEVEPVFAFDGFGGSKFDGGFFMRSAVRNSGARESEAI